MRKTYGHLHYFTKETALATLADVGFEIVDFFYTDDYSIDDMIPRTLWPLKPRIKYEIRKFLYWIKPDVSAALFDHFNLMVLARGSRAINESSE